MGQIINDRKRKSEWDWFSRDKRLYDCWLNMRKRIRLSQEPKYFGYRGLTICDEWSEYWPFHVWAFENGYAKGLTLDRIDNAKGYSPANCRWVTMEAQHRNRRSNRLVTAFGETKLVIEWLEDPRCQAREKALYARLSAGWEPEYAITAPKGSKPQFALVN